MKVKTIFKEKEWKTMNKASVSFTVNDYEYTFLIGNDIKTEDTLAYVLREKLGLTGVRVSCEQGACGACTVLVDGRSALSCMMLAVEADKCNIQTIEYFDGSDEVVNSFIETCEPGYGTTMQCGFCTPGFVLEAHSILNQNPHPTKEEIKDGLSGHICRCGCYKGIAYAVEKVAGLHNHECQCKEEPANE
jgi:carbon-monoxide dehydrogenase small subunit